ncbi:MAG: ATPase domain-containing protein [Brevinematia bacterium]
MAQINKLSTGCEGLDLILKGGLTESGVNLVEGSPGSGKTTISIQFLNAGIKNNEKVLFISLEENETQIKKFFSHVRLSHNLTEKFL